MIPIENQEQPFQSPEETKDRLNHVLASMKDALAKAERAQTSFNEMFGEIESACRELEIIVRRLSSTDIKPEVAYIYQEQLEIIGSLLESRTNLHQIFEEEMRRADELEKEFEMLQSQLSALSRKRPQA